MDSIRLLIPILLLISVVIFLLLMACSRKSFQPETYKGDIITFGKGGGFTGMEEATLINKSGQVFYKASVEGELSFLGKLRKKEVNELMDFIEQENLLEYQYNKPGNAYAYFQLQDRKRSYDRIVWELGDEEVADSATQFVKMAVDFVKELRKQESSH